MKRQYLLIMLWIVSCVSIYGQVGHFKASVSGGEMFTSFTSTTHGTKITGKFGNTISVLGSISISNYLALGSGIGYSQYASTISLNSFFSATSKTDDESDSYDYRVYGTNLKENEKIEVLEIPFVITLQNQEIRRFNPYLQVGFKALLPVHSHFDCLSGVVESRGYYPALNVELKNMPEHKFEVCNLSGTSGSMATKIGYAGTAELGSVFTFQNFHFVTALFATYGLTEIVKTGELSTLDQEYKSISSVAKIKPLSIGIKIGIEFNSGKRKIRPEFE